LRQPCSAQPLTFVAVTAVAHAGHYIDDDFAQDPDIKLEWTFCRGAGPALNESLAAGQLDFAAGLGDLPAIVGRANGLSAYRQGARYHLERFHHDWKRSSLFSRAISSA
jgi:ABC-type nitrate/sulfonate/bicarbonate transport system substrate-binding protein